MKLCECGCGQPTPLATRSRTDRGWVKGEPMRFAPGHHRNSRQPEFVEHPVTNCWLWRRAKATGYGVVNVEGRQVGAHRVYYELYVGPIPAGYQIHHECETAACVNPGHLTALSPGEHAQTRRSRGGTSAYRGVTWSKRAGKWTVLIGLKGKKYRLGYFTDEREAARAAAEFRARHMPHSPEGRAAA